MARLFLLVAVALYAGCNNGGPEEDNLEQARLLYRAGRYSQALMLYQEVTSTGEYNSLVQLEYAETAVLASQAERSRTYRQMALEALTVLDADRGEVDPAVIGEMWRRLGWEMARDRDSLQAYSVFERALQIEGMDQVFEDEWLLRGTYSGNHLSQVASLPDSLFGTPEADSILTITAEKHLVELDRISLVRTDLREAVLRARAMLLPYVDRPVEELEVLTELDRLGGIDPGWRHRRMELLLKLAADDIEQGRTSLAREKLLEVWSSDFVGKQVEAAVMLGEMAEQAGDASMALRWYRDACQVSPGLTSAAALTAAAKRDSLLYLLP
jgi:tetratricopeptide (TPR) repeat protein